MFVRPGPTIFGCRWPAGALSVAGLLRQAESRREAAVRGERGKLNEELTEAFPATPTSSPLAFSALNIPPPILEDGAKAFLLTQLFLNLEGNNPEVI